MWVEFEDECRWTNWREGSGKPGDWDEFCEDGYVTDGDIRLRPCPQCHGRGKVPNAAGYELIEFVKFWIDREQP